MAQVPDNELPPEVRLAARLRLQRLVFGAFAAVLIVLGALGLAAYRRMQGEVNTALRQFDATRADLADEHRIAEQLRRESAAQREELEALSRAMGLQTTRLAAQAARQRDHARGRALLQDAQRHGAPAWWPLAAALCREPDGDTDGPGRIEARLRAGTARVSPFGCTVDGAGVTWTWRPGTEASETPGAVTLAGREIVTVGVRQINWSARKDAIAGRLMGAAEGVVVLWREPATLAVVWARGELDLRAPAAQAPDATVIAADGTRALFRFGRDLHSTDLKGDLRPAFARRDEEPGALAVAADGSAMAACWGAAVAVRGVDGVERRFNAASTPAALALLCGSAVVACAERESLALYEADGGLELARWPAQVRSLAATLDDSLLLVRGGALHVLDLLGK